MKNLKLLLVLTLLNSTAVAQLFDANFTRLDEKIQEMKDSLKIPGIQIAITSADSIAFIKGYGYSNIEDSSIVNPFDTKFHIGSITKVFTAITVQNAANNGHLSLDTDISHYLNFNIDRPYKDKISLNTLLSHSAGIDEAWYNGGDNYINIENVGETLDQIPIRQIRPAGETLSYSNLSANLAGYILAHQTQKPTYKHYEDVIYKPLNLQNTGVFLNRDNPSYPVSYYLLEDKFFESPHNPTSLYTAGNIYSTAFDMSKFMRALLNHGALDSKASLSSDFLSQIGSERFSYTEHKEYGCGLGIFITDIKQGKVYSHLGFVQGFASSMYLFENEKVGIFLSSNSQKGVQALQDILLYFLKEYLPQYKSDKIQASENNVKPDRYVGNYISTRTPLSGIGKIESLFSPRLRFDVSDSGKPILASGNQEIILVPNGENKYVDTTKFIHKTISFHQGEDRLIMNYATDKGVYAVWPFMHVKWYEQQSVQYPFRIICLICFIFIPIFWLVRFFVKKSSRISTMNILLSMAMLSAGVGFILFILSSLDYERMLMLSNASLPWQINAFAFLNIFSAVITVLVIFLRFISLRFHRWDYVLLVLLILTALNNYLYNSFSVVKY